MATSTTTGKPVMVVGLDESEHSFYSLNWTIDHFFAPYAPNYPFNSSCLCFMLNPCLGFPGPSVVDVLLFVEADLKKLAATVLEKANCISKQATDVLLEVMEGDARNVICETVDKHHASTDTVLLVGCFR